MDQFKPDEMKAMEIGGNENARDWMESHGLDLSLPPQEKYTNSIAEDYKDKLAADIQGVEWVPKKREPVQPKKQPVSSGGSITNQPKGVDPETKSRNEAYFSTLGKANDTRPADLPPSQGGKYQGFGSSPSQPHPDSAASVFDNFQNDPLGSLTKGWGIFARTVTKTADQVNEQYIKPSVKNLSEGEVGQTTKKAMLQFGQKMQETGRYGVETFNTYSNGSSNGTQDSQYSKLFDDVADDQPPSLFEDQDTKIEPAFGLSRPTQKTKLQGLGNPQKKDEWEQDGWEKF